MRKSSAFFIATLLASILAFIVVMLGAYTRLKDAGLGCPDWPGCYGQLTVPQSRFSLLKASQLFPKQTVQPQKAWLEMVHRYAAGTLGAFILVLAIWATLRRKHNQKQILFIPWLLVLLVIGQALLGMWTVTLKLIPTVVTAHLLGGMAILALLWALTLLNKNNKTNTASLGKLKLITIVGLFIVGCQIFLGGWTSANYAGLACAHFPFCHGKLFPTMNFAQAFNLFMPIGKNYDGGYLNSIGRTTIQMTHRYGGFIVFIYIGLLALYLTFNKKMKSLHKIGVFMLIVLLTQISLGILNVEKLLPLTIAVAHNGAAALLLLSVVTLTVKLYRKP